MLVNGFGHDGWLDLRRRQRPRRIVAGERGAGKTDPQLRASRIGFGAPSPWGKRRLGGQGEAVERQRVEM
jgi:hypothetical protein